MDRRQRKTQDAIFAAFAALMQRKRYEHITVQDIIDEANIGRSTFYAHFETKDELLHAICRQIFDHVFSEELAGEKTHDFSGGHTGLRERLTHLLYHLREEQQEVAGQLEGESRTVFMAYFMDGLTTLFARGLPQDPAVPQEYRLHHCVAAYAETVTWWVQRKMEIPPETLVEYYYSVTRI